MSRDWYSLDELADHLGRSRLEIEKLVNRGRIPGRRIGGEWQFHPTEITHWLEQEMREYTDRELAIVEQTQRSTEVDQRTPVASLMRPETVQVPLPARTKRSVLESLIEVAGRSWQIWQPAVLLNAIQERESVLSTAFENGVAIPHPRNPLPDALGESVIAFGLCTSGIAFGAPNRALTDMFFLVLCRDSKTHLQVLARLGRMIQSPEFLQSLREAPDSAEAYRLICEADQRLGG
ncbi:MAG: PTS sugar transporter subunit IIA [Planctomycetaceae bacterium]|nr:PTS sugar transporter subunit IIA [Planctomycetaceae bacterium]